MLFENFTEIKKKYFKLYQKILETKKMVTYTYVNHCLLLQIPENTPSRGLAAGLLKAWEYYKNPR